MLSRTKFCGILAAVAMQTLAVAQKPRAAVEKVAFLGENPIRLQVQTSIPLTPQVQVISSPERLVIDLPNSVPGRGLRAVTINRGEVRGVRTSLFSQSPLVTRIVVDLNTPQWYRITPGANGFVISLGGQAQGAADAQATVGWVSTKSSARVAKAQTLKVVAKRPNPEPRHAPVVNGASVKFAEGKLSIHATNATLSEVLFQIQKVTGAEIAIPAGTEQQRVAGDFGPGSASDVLGELLNGSGLNFVVVGSPSDSTQLRSVLLSRKEGEADAPSAFAQQDAPDSAQNDGPQDVNSDNSEPATPVPQQAPPQQNLPPDSGPPADPPPN